MESFHITEMFIRQVKLAITVLCDMTLVVLDLWLEILDAIQKLHQI